MSPHDRIDAGPSIPTLRDGIDFLRGVPEMGIVTHAPTDPRQKANQALADFRAGRLDRAAEFPA